MRNVKKFLVLLVVATMILTLWGCGDVNPKETDTVHSIVSSMINENNKNNNELVEEDKNAQLEYSTSSPENDTDIGMRNIKIDSADATLTNDQRLVRAYFDKDYLIHKILR